MTTITTDELPFCGAIAPTAMLGERTEWYPTPAQSPTRPGEYETRYDGSRPTGKAAFTRRYWNGGQWLFWADFARDWVPSNLDEMINAEWRGLAQEPQIKARKTPWFQSRSARPTRPGVYLTRMGTGNVYWRAFDGENWRCSPTRAYPDSRNPGYAVLSQHAVLSRYFETDSFTHFEWRGLTEAPALRRDDMDRPFDPLRG